MEPQNLGNEAVKSSKRRLSSILKAPRTSLKLLGVEQEELKEEVAKPVEKSRNSRRVSFATTNNVRVFTNEAKSESPVLGSIQNLHEERPDEKILRFADEGSHQIKGLETLLNTPLYLTQNKENFFSDPVLQDDYVDRTILLGEDTGYMDITHSHTITFDKDYEIKEEANQDVSFKVAQTVCGDSNIASQKAEKKNVSMDSDFSAFLASMHLPTLNTVKLQRSENELSNASSSANTSISEIDKENFLPSFLTKQPSTKCQPLQPRGLQRRRSRVSFIENGESGPTMGRTAVTENIDSAQSFTPSISKNHRSVPIMTSAFPDVSDDMEFTAPVNAKFTENITCSVQTALDQNRSHHFSEEDNAMEMTGVSDISIRNKDYTVNMREQSQPSVPKVRRMSSLTVIGNGEITDQSNASYFQGNLSVARTTDCDNMEMTEALDVSLQDKEKALFPKVSRRSTFDVFENGHIMQNKSNSSFMVRTANSDDMEMTEVIDLESKPSVENKLLSSSRNSLPLASISRTVQEDEHTSIMKENSLHPIPTVNRKTCFNDAENGTVLDYNKSDNFSIAHDDNSGDMEITECQTELLEIKPSTKNKSFGNFWKSLPSSSSRTVGEDEHTGSVKKEALCPTSSVNKMPCFNSNSDDMEITQCHTVFLQPKHVSGDESLSISMKSGPLTSVFGTEGGDEMDMTQVPTGRIILNGHSSNKNEKGESILIPASATSPVHNKSDHMDLTCLKSTFAETSLPCLDEMEFTACVTDSASNRTGRTVDITDIRAPFSANQTVTVVEPMEMTEVHMAPFSERKHKAFMTRRKSGARMMSLMCNSGNTEADNCQIDFTNSDNMDMTQCQTAVLEAETYKSATPFNKSRRNLNSASISCSPDGMEITQPLTGKIMLKSFASNQESKHQQNLLPEAQSCQMQNESQCMELTCQASPSNIAIPYVDDEMELTGCNTIAMDSKSTLATSAAEIKVNESALWASTTVSKCTVSSEEPNEGSEAAKCTNNSVFPSKDLFDLGGKNVKCSNTETMSYIPPDMQVDKNCETALPSNVMANDEDDMQVTKPLTLPIEIEQAFSFNQSEETNASSGFSNDEEGQAHNAKARRRSLMDFQMELHNMSQRILEEPNLMTVSATAPLPSCTTSENVQNEIESSPEPASNITPVVKQKNNSAQNQKTTPFSLNKKSFSSRMSLCGVVPKLPKRSTAFTPNKSLPISTNDLPCLQLEKHFKVAEQKSNQTVDINDEEFPEMSGEEDLSGSLENWPVSKQDELEESLAVPIKEEFLIDDVFESGTSMSPSFKRQHPEEEPITAEQTKKACVSDMGSDCHEAAVQWEGNFTRHAAQNLKAKTIEDTGVSESTLRHSQFDSHMDGMQDNLFDFNKKLEDGSITVNEFLSHFGIKFVIHRSRPSALPVSCGAGETRTMEDLLKEKYICHPKQRVYEQDCKNLTEIVERLKEQMSAQEKSLRSINGALQKEICTLSEEQLKSFGSKLKERRAYFGKKSKAVSHEMKEVLYSELIKTTQDAKLSLISKIKETDEMIEDLDGCIKDLETDLASVDAMITGDHLDLPKAGPALKAKEEDLHRLNSAVTDKEREIGELEIQLKTLESQQEKLQGESSSLKSHLATLNRLNEWRLEATDETKALFSFLHKTVHLQVNLQTPAGKEWMTEDVEKNVDVVFQLQLDGHKSECHASMIHNLLATKIESQTHWKQRFTTTRHIPELLHNMSLVVGRLRLLGEEIHRLKKWGGLRLRILKITCTDTRVHVIFSSLKAFEKFELSLTVTPDYPFGPLHIQDFKKHMGTTRLDQLEEIISSVKPAKNYLTKILKKIHDDLLC